MSVPIILASGSPVRARLLRHADVPFEVELPRVDESAVRDSLIAEGAPPRDIADALAELKALRIGQRRPDRMVLAADQVLVSDGQLLPKATDRDDAFRILRGLAGSTHQLISAVVIVEDAKPVWRLVDTVTLAMRPLSDAFLRHYLETAWPDVAGCVGCYKLEGDGLRLFSRIDGDHYTGLGLPILPVLSYLASRGKVPT